MKIDNEEYLTTTEACKQLGVSRQTIHSYVKVGKLKRYRIKGRISYYKESDTKLLFSLREC